MRLLQLQSKTWAAGVLVDPISSTVVYCPLLPWLVGKSRLFVETVCFFRHWNTALFLDPLNPLPEHADRLTYTNPDYTPADTAE